MNVLMNPARLLIIILFLIMLLQAAPVTAAPPEQYEFLNLTQAFQKSSAEKKPMVLYFGRYGCSTCRKMHKEVFSDPSMIENYNKKFVLAYVDTESGNRIKMPNGERTTEMQFATRNRILGTPTFIYFSHDQEPLFKKAGFQTIEEMNRYSEFVDRKLYKTTTLKDFRPAQ